jgi:hypothetical protein
MLSDLERTRLKTRETDSPKIRAMNDLRVKKKLRAWLDDGFDALEIFDAIPLDKLKEELTDGDVCRLLKLARYIMIARKFMAVQGELEKHDGWEAVGYGITRPADKTDIIRSVLVDVHANALKVFVGPHNPAPYAMGISDMLKGPDKDKWSERFTPEEKEGIAEVEGIMHTFLQSKEKPPKR